jgi:hypothetical protein
MTISLTVEQAIALAGVLNGVKSEPPKEAIGKIGRPVIVRSRDAGVLFGEYAGNDGSTVHLTNARQLWKWHAAQGGTLIDCARYGVKASNCKFSPAQATVTVFNACALIDCKPDAAASIIAVEGGSWE